MIDIYTHKFIYLKNVKSFRKLFKSPNLFSESSNFAIRSVGIQRRH